MFFEKFVESPRHIEVQIFGDSHGTVVHLGERDCSIQRRYQKVIEEAPSPAVDEALRDDLGRAAVAAGKALSYAGAGTVEFVMAQNGLFYFLEVNTRLQVEHPVTEMVTGLDLVRGQLLVASGQALPSDMLATAPRGHAVEVRLYAEDVAAGFIPASGTLHTLEFPTFDGVRVDAGFTSGSTVSTFYDPMLAKVIGYGQTREDACAKVARALRETRIHGVSTNRDLLIGILRESEFRSGAIDTGYLQRHYPAELMAATAGPHVGEVHALIAAVAAQSGRRNQAPVLAHMPSGWRTLPSAPQQVAFTAEDGAFDVQYRFERGVLHAVVGDWRPTVTIFKARADLVDAEVDGTRRRYSIFCCGTDHYVDSALGSTVLHETPRFPDPHAAQEAGSLLAPMPGAVVRIEAIEGTRVCAGAPIVVLEAMKMEHTVRAAGAGVIATISVAAGDQVDSGQVLAVVVEDGNDQ